MLFWKDSAMFFIDRTSIMGFNHSDIDSISISFSFICCWWIIFVAWKWPFLFDKSPQSWQGTLSIIKFLTSAITCSVSLLVMLLMMKFCCWKGKRIPTLWNIIHFSNVHMLDWIHFVCFFFLVLCFDVSIFCLNTATIPGYLPSRYVALRVAQRKPFCCIFFILF